MVLCSSILNLSKSSKLLHPHSQVLAFEASEASSQLAKLEVFWRTALGNLWYLGPLLSTGRLKWTRDAHPRGVLGLVKGWRGLFSLEGACPNGHWDSAELGYRGPAWPHVCESHVSPFLCGLGRCTESPTALAAASYFVLPLKIYIFILFQSWTSDSTSFFSPPPPMHFFPAHIHACLYLYRT